jgi:mRNA interferase MazF
MNKILYGEIWRVELDPVVGREQAKCRPCLVVSVNLFNLSPDQLAAVIPLTTVFRPTRWFVEINPPEGGVSKLSYIMCHQVRTVSHLRFSGKCLGTVSDETLEAVRKRLEYIFNP